MSFSFDRVRLLTMHRRQLFIIFFLIFSGFCQAMRADERAESTRGFKNWDKNGDGFLVPLEVPEGPREIFNNVDRNKDGKVTLEEHLLACLLYTSDAADE